MTFEDLKQAVDRRPFVPFDIRDDRGGATRVRHPEDMECIDGERPMVSVKVPRGGVMFIGLNVITALDIPAASPKRAEKKGGKRP